MKASARAGRREARNSLTKAGFTSVGAPGVEGASLNAVTSAYGNREASASLLRGYT